MNLAALLHLPFFRVAARPAPAAAVVRLERRGLWTAGRLAGCRIVCGRGCVWLTHDGDPRDVVLMAGESHVVDRDSRLIAVALQEAEVRVVPPAMAQPRGFRGASASAGMGKVPART